MNLNKKDYYILGGLVAVGFLYWKLIKGNSTKKNKSSSFNGAPFGQRVMFTLSNKTDKVQSVPLFNAYSNIQNSNVSITPSIAEFNRTLLNEPKLLQMIEIRASGNQKQAEQPIQVNCKDASGEFKGTYLNPMVSVYQKALDMTSVKPNNLILNGQCYLGYTLAPKQTVMMIFHYQKQDKMEEAKSLQKKMDSNSEKKSSVLKKEIKKGLTTEDKKNNLKTLGFIAVGGLIGGIYLSR